MPSPATTYHLTPPTPRYAQCHDGNHSFRCRSSFEAGYVCYGVCCHVNGYRLGCKLLSKFDAIPRSPLSDFEGLHQQEAEFVNTVLRSPHSPEHSWFWWMLMESKACKLRLVATNSLHGEEILRFRISRFAAQLQSPAQCFGWGLLQLLDHLDARLGETPRPTSYWSCWQFLSACSMHEMIGCKAVSLSQSQGMSRSLLAKRSNLLTWVTQAIHQALQDFLTCQQLIVIYIFYMPQLEWKWNLCRNSDCQESLGDMAWHIKSASHLIIQELIPTWLVGIGKHRDHACWLQEAEKLRWGWGRMCQRWFAQQAPEDWYDPVKDDGHEMEEHDW